MPSCAGLQHHCASAGANHHCGRLGGSKCLGAALPATECWRTDLADARLPARPDSALHLAQFTPPQPGAVGRVDLPLLRCESWPAKGTEAWACKATATKRSVRSCCSDCGHGVQLLRASHRFRGKSTQSTARLTRIRCDAPCGCHTCSLCTVAVTCCRAACRRRC